MSQVVGPPTGVTSEPKAVTVGGTSFSNPGAGITDAQWVTINAAWGATPKKDITIDYTAGPPIVVTKVSGA